MRWERSGRIGLRSLTRADLAGLESALLGPSGGIEEFEEPDFDRLERLLKHAPTLQRAIEYDGVLIGAALAIPTRKVAPQVAHPWSHSPTLTSPKVPPLEPDGDYLWGCGLFWRAKLEAAQRTDLIAVARKGLVQEFGYEAISTRVPLADYERESEAMSPEAYLQQVHAGSLRDEPLSTWLDHDFLLQGWARRDHGALVAGVRWDNRVR